MTPTQFDTIVTLLQRTATALEAMAGTNTPLLPVGAAAAVSPWVSPGLPAGYDTVLGFFSETMPSAFDMMVDPIVETQKDGFWCKHQAARRGLHIVKVAAPEALFDTGITELNAYPVELLRERIAA